MKEDLLVLGDLSQKFLHQNLFSFSWEKKALFTWQPMEISSSLLTISGMSSESDVGMFSTRQSPLP